MRLNRLVKLLTMPLRLLHARIAPVSYARGRGVRMKGKVTIYGSSYTMFSTEPFLVSLGDNVFISVGAQFVPHDGGTLPFRREIPSLELAAPISVGDNVFIGMGALILKGVTIGDDCIIGANSVVTKHVPRNSIVAGNPARFVRATDEWLEKAKAQSLGFGHITGYAKEREYRRVFGLDRDETPAP